MPTRCSVVNRTIPNIKDIAKTIQQKRLIRRIFILCVCLFVSSIIYNFFQVKAQLVTGGTSGIAIITQYLFEWDPSLVILITSATLLILSFFLLGIEQTSGAIIATFIFPFFVKLTSDWPHMIPVETTDMFLISIFIGVVDGITNGLVYKNGFNNGGTSIISQLLFKYQKISISTTSFVLNMIIVLTGGFFFGWTMVMYATIILYINSIVTDRVLIGISRNKNIFIMTYKEKEIRDYVLNTLHHGITEFDVKGGFEFHKKKVLMTVIPTKDYFRLKEGVKLIDKDVFVIVTDSYQTSGGA